MEVRHISSNFNLCNASKKDASNNTAQPQEYLAKEESSKAKCSFGQSMVNMQNPSKDEICKILDTIVKPYTIYRYHNTKTEGHPIHAKAGNEIPEWKNLYNENLHLAVYLDTNKDIEEIYIQDNDTKAINVLDKNGNTLKSISSTEIASLFEYKYYPENFHKYLRYNRPLPQKTETELLKHIDTIDNCFKNNNKVFKTNNETIVYRALPEYLSINDLNTIHTIGAIYKDNSYVSTTQKLDTAKRFSCGKTPIMEITLPKESPYLDLDRLFNIDRQRWNEQEFLLKRGSEFLITGYDKEKNIIKAQYLNK